MTTPALSDAAAVRRSTVPSPPVLDVVVPVYNEQDDLEPCVRRLVAYLRSSLPFTFRVTVADNASTDATLAVAARLAGEYAEVRAVHLPQKGRGRALRSVWSGSDAEVLAYMDVDLSTDLNGVLPLIAPLVSGHSDVAIGTRLSRSSRVVRGAKRELISRAYNTILRRTLAAGFSDAQCGFKAVRRDVAQRVLPLVEDPGWFFDTELLVVAQRAGLRIHEVPVDWVDDPDSRVDIVSTAVADLKGVARLSRALATGSLPIARLRAELGRGPLQVPSAVPGVPRGMAAQLARFAAIGLASTLAYVAVFALLRGSIGGQAANVVALLLTAVANTAANRRLTFGVTTSEGTLVHQAQGLVVFALGLGLSSGALALLHSAGGASGSVELVVLVAANLLATVLRFVLLRAWVFRQAPTAVASSSTREEPV
ncbi:bifunctional glycosyltransferase family 2/GtrA family protein [Motilibacter peucedani]|nr:bifunctional glycosyltransferase family 2/GtrA family protein [Motilibacter peucedani]